MNTAGRRWNLIVLMKRLPPGPGGSSDAISSRLAGVCSTLSEVVAGTQDRLETTCQKRFHWHGRLHYDRSVPQVTLAIVEGRDAGREFPLTGNLLVGRDPSSDVVIGDTEVSTRHAS